MQGLLDTPQNLSVTQFRTSSGPVSHQGKYKQHKHIRYSCPNWHVTSLSELYLCFVAGHVPYKFQRNPITSFRDHNSWVN